MINHSKSYSRNIFVAALVASTAAALVPAAPRADQKKEGVKSLDPRAETSKRVARAMLENLEKKDIDAWSKLWDENGVQEMPFSPEGFPKRLAGKAALYNQYKDLPKNFTEMKFPITRISILEDPEWVLMEYDGQIKLKAGGEYNNRYISVLHIANGKIQLLREYFDPLVLQRAFGGNLKSNFNVKKGEERK